MSVSNVPNDVLTMILCERISDPEDRVIAALTCTQFYEASKHALGPAPDYRNGHGRHQTIYDAVAADNEGVYDNAYLYDYCKWRLAGNESPVFDMPNFKACHFFIACMREHEENRDIFYYLRYHKEMGRKVKDRLRRMGPRYKAAHAKLCKRFHWLKSLWWERMARESPRLEIHAMDAVLLELQEMLQKISFLVHDS